VSLSYSVLYTGIPIYTRLYTYILVYTVHVQSLSTIEQDTNKDTIIEH